MSPYADHADFHCLRSRLRLQGVLTTKTALRIGSGGGGDLDASDLPVLRDADGYPLIPGASLKGSLRSTVEALVRGADPDGTHATLWACDPLDDAPTARGMTCGRHASGEGNRADALRQRHCATCRLFGSRVIASHVRFTDAMLRGAESIKRKGRIPIEVRDGVAIDRDLRTVHGAQKYDFEVIAPGTAFELEVFVENPDPVLMGLLVIGFDQLADGFTALGGFSSRGLGRVTLTWASMSRFNARDLLANKKEETLDGAALTAEFDAWRAALAKEAG